MTSERVDLAEILARKLRALFPDKRDREQALAILQTYGIEKHEQEPERVRLAILKLTGRDMGKIREHTEFAKQDFRDILTWAEYPRQSRKWSMPDGPKKHKLIDADRAEYENWLHRD